MIREINRHTLAEIQNIAFSNYASKYLDVYDDFMKQVEGTGLEISQDDHLDQVAALYSRLEEKGAILRNDEKSIYINHISPACVACRESIGSATFFISLQCNRDCYFCFNPNQEHYDNFTKNKRNLTQELDQIKENGHQIHHLALTGGEPLIHMEESIDFFQHAKENFPDAHSRLYTSGDFLDKDSLQQFKDTGLKEIRFSIRLQDSEKGIQETLEKISLSKDFISSVMVEMPVLPHTLDTMKKVLLELDDLEIYGVNLLEFCFPFNNAKVFRNKGFEIKNSPCRILYDYWYAGGLPIAGSEIECLQLLEFAIDNNLGIGIHYCSLENKHTGQIYQQNFGKKVPSRAYFSEKDFFFKTGKVFGDDVKRVQRRFNSLGEYDCFIDTDLNYLEFHVNKIPLLQEMNLEVGISSSVIEQRDDGECLRELKVELVYPETFQLEIDV